MSVKLLIWDGDETLWNGTIMEGDKIYLPEGRLKFCESLYNMGCLQSVASKNTMANVEEALHKLGLSQMFLASQGDLEKPKSEMVQHIMKELNIVNPEEIIFVDDNGFNVAEVRSKLGVYSMLGVDEEKIETLTARKVVTEEDKNRVRSYRAELERDKANEAYDGDKMEFLKSCEMEAKIRPATELDLPRIHSLVERANQFSAAMRPYLKRDGVFALHNGQLFVLEAEDKFGKYGLSGVCRCSKGKISLFVISCRLQGKGYGSAFLGWMINNQNVTLAEWMETQYNVGVRNLFEWYGFSIEKMEESCVAVLPSTVVSLPDWISITSES